jgi:hypothetical protein
MKSEKTRSHETPPRSHQAEQIILSGGAADPSYGVLAPQATVATVHCTQNSQSFIARVRGLIVNEDLSGHAASNDPPTYYTCAGASTIGQPMYWCVTYPPRDNYYNVSPQITARQSGTLPDLKAGNMATSAGRLAAVTSDRSASPWTKRKAAKRAEPGTKWVRRASKSTCDLSQPSS